MTWGGDSCPGASHPHASTTKLYHNWHPPNYHCSFSFLLTFPVCRFWREWDDSVTEEAKESQKGRGSRNHDSSTIWTPRLCLMLRKSIEDTRVDQKEPTAVLDHWLLSQGPEPHPHCPLALSSFSPSLQKSHCHHAVMYNIPIHLLRCSEVVQNEPVPFLRWPNGLVFWSTCG